MLERVEKREPSCTIGGNVNWYSHYGEQYGGSLKTKNRITIWLSNPTTGHIPRENHNSKRHMHPNIHCSTIYNSHVMEATYMPIDRWIDKEVVVHIYNGILLSHKKEWNWVIFRDVDGSRDCHTEWSKLERKKQISYINGYVWNLEKWYRWTSLQGRNWDTDVENKRIDTKGRKRRGVVVVWWIGRLGVTCIH